MCKYFLEKAYHEPEKYVIRGTMRCIDENTQEEPYKTKFEDLKKAFRLKGNEPEKKEVVKEDSEEKSEEDIAGDQEPDIEKGNT